VQVSRPAAFFIIDSPSKDAMLCLLICDASALDRETLRLLLAEHSEIDFIGEAEDGHEAVELAADLGPDVIVMDVVMPLQPLLALDGGPRRRGNSQRPGPTTPDPGG
jgi:CheY-like chemotaxis protein